MKVDMVAAMQGVLDARNDERITKETCEKVLTAFRRCSSPGENGRNVCNYITLMTLITECTEKMESGELASLWKRLGSSLGSGIWVARPMRRKKQNDPA